MILQESCYVSSCDKDKKAQLIKEGWTFVGDFAYPDNEEKSMYCRDAKNKIVHTIPDVVVDELISKIYQAMDDVTVGNTEGMSELLYESVSILRKIKKGERVHL